MNDKIKADEVFMVCFPWEEGALKLEGTNTHVKASKDIPELINSLANNQSPTTADASVLKEALEYLINDIKRKPNDTRYATAIKKATDALAQYSTQSLPQPAVEGLAADALIVEIKKTISSTKRQ